MITPSFGLTATERVLPKLALDFTTASLDSRVTLTRALNTATRINSSGVIEYVNADLPRFDYDPITLACKGLLIEETRTNLLTRSIPDAAVPTGYVIGPSGGTGTFTHTLQGGFGVLSGFQNVIRHNQTVSGRSYVSTSGLTLLANTTYTVSVYVDKQNSSITSGSATIFLVSFTGLTGTNTATLDNADANGRISITFTTGTTTLGSIRFGIGAAADATGTCIFGGWQLEQASFPTSYIPTTSAALTRNADVATMTGTNFSNWWSATTGAVKTAVIPSTISGTRPLIQFDDNTATNQICLRGNSANSELYIKATTDQSQIDAGTIVANTAYKLSGAWNTNNCAAAQNGASPVTDSSATIPTVTQARIGSDGTNYANAWIQKILYWPQRLINAEVQAFSKI